MAVSDSSKVDLLYKKLFGVTKTDTPTNKGAGNESIASPALIRGDKVWTESASIPATAADVTNVVQSYLTTSRIECTADTTSTPVSSVYPTWKTNLTNWIPPEFGSTYFVKVYAETAGNANPTNGTPLSDSGAGNAGEWFFDYQSGVLNFIGGTIPAALTAAKVIYITGYRYIGAVGVTAQTTANVANTVLTLSNFTTANLAEGTNLYYTNARVNANIAQMSINVFSDVDITGITTNGTLIWNGSSFIAGTAAASDFAANANIANVVLSISNFTTSNLAEGSNLYYTNARVNSYIQPWLTTANVTETAGNLYFTTARVLANVSQMSINVFADVDITGITSNGVLQWNGAAFVAGTVSASNTSGSSNVANTVLSLDNFTTANLAEGINLYYTNSRVLSIVTPLLTTSNVAEGSNLYYTNARVYANITAALSGNLVIGNLVTGTSVSNSYVTAGNVNAGNLIATTLILGSATGGSLTGANLVSATNIQGNIWIGLYTANVIESSNALYYTNSRVNSFIQGNLATKANVSDLTTANVSELTNLYYTNSRVYSNVIALLPTLAGAGIEIQANGQINSNVVLTLATLSPFLTTSNVTEGSNLYYTNARVYSAIQSNLATKANVSDLTTANVTELTNQYFTNARAVLAIAPYLTTSNISEGSNLYYTNARVVSAVTPYLTTANVIETSANLYFTNARVLANVSQMSINVFADVDMTGLTTSGILIWNGSSFVAGTVSAATSSNTALFAYLADRANTAELSNVANSVISISNFTTSNLIEGSNLYFTNTRAAIGLTGQDISVKDLYAAGNLTVQGDFITLNVATLDIEDKNITLGKGLTTSAQADGAGITIDGAQANITYLVSGDKFNINKNVEILGDIKANTWTGLYTSNVIENTNQFFTNARAVLAITPYLTTANVLESASNLYYTNARVFANVSEMSVNVFTDVDISGINNDELLLWNATDRVFRPSQFSNKLTTANVIELTNLYFTNARVITALSTGTANLSLYNLSTTGVLTLSSGTNDESVAGLEFSNNPAGGAGDTAKIKYYAANIGINDDTVLEISVANNPGDSINFKTMGGGVGVNVARPIAEFDVAGNINARNSLIFSSVVVGPTALFNAVTANTWNNLYTSNVIEGNNLYYTNSRVLSIVTPLLTTSNVAEGSNLYYTNARVYANVINLLAPKANVVDLTTANVTELTNQYFTNARVILAVTPYLTTSNVAEGSNLYYTNARVNSYIQGNLATKANVTDLTTSNVIEGTSQYFTNARVFANVSEMSVNVFADVDITGVQTGYVLTWNGSQFITSAPSGVVNTANTALFAANANVANSVISISNFTTANLAEGTSLYYTNTRVYSNVISTLAGNVTIGNLKVSTAVNYSNTTGVTKVYQYYNESSQSLDTIFL
jgi:hypothetical protein